MCVSINFYNGAKALLVERFDRFYELSGTIKKVHQEDACQFLDRYPADKYRLSLSEILEGVAPFATAPLLDIATVLRITAFSYLIRNGNLHAKNISLYEDPTTGYCTVTPAYDLISTYIYGDTKMALQMEGRDAHIKRRDFIALGERFKVPSKVTAKMLATLVQKITPHIKNLDTIGFEDKKRGLVEKMMLERVGELSE